MAGNHLLYWFNLVLTNNDISNILTIIIAHIYYNNLIIINDAVI